MPVEVNCATCGSAFAVPPSRVERSENHFCDLDCKGEYQEGQDRGGERTTCENCGESFAAQSGNPNRFCSRDCYNDHRRATGEGGPDRGERIEVECENCGATLERPPWHVRQSDRQFCNTECMGDWQSENVTGESHPNWKGGYEPYYGEDWQRQRERAILRDDEGCVLCGRDRDVHYAQFGQDLHVHHKTDRSDGGTNDLDNLVTLCRPCHFSV